MLSASEYISLLAYWLARLKRTLKVRSRLCDSLSPACSRSLMRLLSLVEASLARSSPILASPFPAARHDSSISSVTFFSRALIFSSGVSSFLASNPGELVALAAWLSGSNVLPPPAAVPG